LFIVVLMIVVVGAIVFVEGGSDASRCSTPNGSSAGNVRWADDSPAAENKHLGGDSSDFRVIGDYVSGDHCEFCSSNLDEGYRVLLGARQTGV